MADLDDIRRLLRGEEVEGLKPAPAPRPKKAADGAEPTTVDLSKMNKLNARFSVSMDGKDATLHFGRYKGRTVSSMLDGLNAVEERGYLFWMLKQEFPADLKSVVQYQLDAYDKADRAGKT